MFQSTSEIKKQIKQLELLVEIFSPISSKLNDKFVDQLKKKLMLLKDKLEKMEDKHKHCKDKYCDCWLKDDPWEPPGDCDYQQPNPNPQPTPFVPHYAFVYTITESRESRNVLFTVASPIHDEVELNTEGIKVSKGGVYQINYTVVVKSTPDVTSPAKFYIVINNDIQVVTSLTEPSSSQHVTSTQLVSLLEGDVVKLVAELPEGISYTMASMQLLQVE
ncbi:hypothetical protein [Lysinibacillus antri]|uniref:Uncharacterized protein n=1 Tax=Lysinibacillus antri TaxID=2498145 RepID=A0A432LBD5_9BACI|nr:hypothetical protein [Lysinibacillus antri]RUL52021.1 hypothetical protein EK386_10515 [Lysinibacillus antri]